MADIKLDEDKAKMWIFDVKSEISRVDIVLGNVSNALETIPSEEDTIFKGIHDVGISLKSSWSSMITSFKKANELLDEAVHNIFSVVSDLIDELPKKGR